MTTNFFSKLSELLNGFDVNITITKTGDVLLVGIYPKAKVKIEETLPPLLLNGTIEELDELFFTKITNAMKRTSGIVTNIAFYAKQMEVAETQAKDKATLCKYIHENLQMLKQEIQKSLQKQPFPGYSNTMIKNYPIPIQISL